MHTSNAEYAPFRRPQTPERHRLYDARDSRASAAGSPQGVFSTTPEVPRYGTPQAYPQRAPPMTGAEQTRDPRISSNPIPLGRAASPRPIRAAPPPRHPDAGRPPQGDIYGRREEIRHPEEYNPERPIAVSQYDDHRYLPLSERDRLERERQERERQDRESEYRDRDRRERALSGGDPNRPYPVHQTDYARLEQREMRAEADGAACAAAATAPVRPTPRPARARALVKTALRATKGSSSATIRPSRLPRQGDYPATTAQHYSGSSCLRALPPTDRTRQLAPPPHQAVQPPPPSRPYDSPERRRHSLPLDRQQPPPPQRARIEESHAPRRRTVLYRHPPSHTGTASIAPGHV